MTIADQLHAANAPADMPRDLALFFGLLPPLVPLVRRSRVIVHSDDQETPYYTPSQGRSRAERAAEITRRRAAMLAYVRERGLATNADLAADCRITPGLAGDEMRAMRDEGLVVAEEGSFPVIWRVA